MNCPNCNKPVKGNEKFCPYCGVPFNSAETVTEVKPSPEKLPEALPRKKSKLPVIIIISVAAAAVIGAGVFFAIWFFGGKDSGSKDTASSSASDSAQAGASSRSGQADEQLSELISNFEKALNDNDEQAMADQFVPERRDLKVGETTVFKYLSELIGQTGQQLTYKLELQDDVSRNGDTASGTLKITVSVPLIGDQSTNAKVDFKKEDGKWYINEIK